MAAEREGVILHILLLRFSNLAVMGIGFPATLVLYLEQRGKEGVLATQGIPGLAITASWGWKQEGCCHSGHAKQLKCWAAPEVPVDC